MKDLVEKDLVGENVLTESLKIRKKYIFDDKVDIKYSALTIAVMFFCFAITGWIIEVGWMYLKQGIIANRGTLIGPWLPIYGYSCVVILCLFTSNRFKNIARNPLFTFLAIMLLCSIAEYLTSLALESIYGLRWWDYSNELFNINGRICLENSVLFGLGGCLCLYIIAPALNKLLEKVPKKVKILLVVILFAIFIVDNVFCIIHPHIGFGITENQIFVKTLKFI